MNIMEDRIVDMLHSGEFENPFADPRRDVAEFADVHWEHASLDSFDGKAELLPGLHTIAHNHVDIDVLYYPLGADTTVVMFHGPLENTDARLPMFVNSMPGAAVNRIYISDPGLYLDPTTTWAGYEDSSGVPLSRILPVIIRRLHKESGAARLWFSAEGDDSRVAERYSEVLG